MENGLLLDLSPLNWSAIEPWAKEIWSYKGKPYGLPLEASTVEVYYNKKLMAISASRCLPVCSSIRPRCSILRRKHARRT